MFNILYINADRDTRMQAAVARADDQALALDIFESRDEAENARFTLFEELLNNRGAMPPNVNGYVIFDNDYTPACLSVLADKLVQNYIDLSTFARLVRKFANMTQLSDDDGYINITYLDTDEQTKMTPEQYASHIFDDRDEMFTLFRHIIANPSLLNLPPLPDKEVT